MPGAILNLVQLRRAGTAVTLVVHIHAVSKIVVLDASLVESVSDIKARVLSLCPSLGESIIIQAGSVVDDEAQLGSVLKMPCGSSRYPH